MINKNVWVMDIETLKGCFTYTGLNVDTEEVVQYVIHKDRDDRIELLDHLQLCKGHVGFNNVGFDYPVIHCFMNEGFYNYGTTEELVDILYAKAQEVINSDDKFMIYKIQKEALIPQLDLFLMWHFNNKARMTSLKSLEIAMNFPNVMDMNIPHTQEDISPEELKMLLEYNLVDVKATYEFYKRSEGKINLRRELNKKYNLKCFNFSDSKIGEQLVLKLYCQKTGLNMWDVRKLKTNRGSIDLKDCIFDYIHFETDEFNALLSNLKGKTIKETKGSIKESVVYKGFKYDYGLGGIHGCIKPGVYNSDDDYVILDADVGSLYPSIAVQNGLYPEHLGKEFCDVYSGILKERLKAKKEGNMSVSDAYKLSLNSVYGKSNDQYSFLLDPLYTMKTTLNGQLMLSMLAEDLALNIKDLTMFQVNTDGLTVKIPRSKVDRYYLICQRWERNTNMGLEYVEYTKMIIKDVNNYLSETIEGKIKYKGAFEVDKDYHKDNSFRIVPLALSEYFINGIPVENTIRKHNNIYDFCGRQKFKKGDHGEFHYLKDDKLNIDRLQKNIRYYISTNGGTLIKVYKKGTVEFIHVGYKATIFNTYIEDVYKIDYSYYIKECYKLIEQIEDKQLTLF